MSCCTSRTSCASRGEWESGDEREGEEGERERRRSSANEKRKKRTRKKTCTRRLHNNGDRIFVSFFSLLSGSLSLSHCPDVEHHGQHTRERAPDFFIAVIPTFETMQTALASSAALTKSVAAAAAARIRGPALAPRRQKQSRSVSAAADKAPSFIHPLYSKVRRA